MHLFSNRSQRMSKCGKNISDTLGCATCATFLFLPHFDVICDLLLDRRTATWNLLVKYLLNSPKHTQKMLQHIQNQYQRKIYCNWLRVEGSGGGNDRFLTFFIKVDNLVEVLTSYICFGLCLIMQSKTHA